MSPVTEEIFQNIVSIFDRQGLTAVTQVIMVTNFTTALLVIVRTFAIQPQIENLRPILNEMPESVVEKAAFGR